MPSSATHRLGPTRACWIGYCPRFNMASVGDATGWTWPGSERVMDTKGTRSGINAWPYRDYVISSFNQDKPYPQFVREQLAGDVLEPVTRESIAGTGFLVAAPWDDVGHSQQSATMRARVRADEMEDVVGTVAQTLPGSDGQLCPLPRSQVRSHFAEGLLSFEGYSGRGLARGPEPLHQHRGGAASPPLGALPEANARVGE